jgi:hypothetical protein
MCRWLLLLSSILLAAHGLGSGPLPVQAGLDTQSEAPPADGPSRESGSGLALERRLIAAALTETDVPGHLERYNPFAIFRPVGGGLPQYSVTFLASSLPASSAPGTLVSVHNLVTQVDGPGVSLDRLITDLRDEWSSATELVSPPPTGEDSRAAATVTAPGSPPPPISTAAVLFRRHDMVVSVAVSAVGGRPPLDEAIRLAQVLDTRVLALGQ